MPELDTKIVLKKEDLCFLDSLMLKGGSVWAQLVSHDCVSAPAGPGRLSPRAECSVCWPGKR